MTNFNHMSVFVYVTFLFTYVKTVRKMLLSLRDYEIMKHSFQCGQIKMKGIVVYILMIIKSLSYPHRLSCRCLAHVVLMVSTNGVRC